MKKRDFIIYYKSRRIDLNNQIESLKNDFTPNGQRTRIDLKKKLSEVEGILAKNKSGMLS